MHLGWSGDVTQVQGWPGPWPLDMGCVFWPGPLGYMMDCPCVWAVLVVFGSISNDPGLLLGWSHHIENWLKIDDMGITRCGFLRRFQIQWSQVGTVRIWFPFTYIHPLTKFPKHFRILWITVYNVTTNILELYLLLQNTLSQSKATEPPGIVTSLSSKSLSESGKYLVWNVFPMHSCGHPIPSPRPRASAAKNKLLWVVYTHKESYKILGTFGNPCESPKGLSDDLQESLVFLFIP